MVLRSRVLAVAVAISLGALLFLAGLLIGSGGQAADVLPGSPGDPLIARSYLEQYVNLNVLELEPGQRLVADAGTEIVLRSGSATAIDGPGGGLADVTAGRDIRMGQPIPRNHLLIVPRSDGRGLLATTSVFVMVRGIYSIDPE